MDKLHNQQKDFYLAKNERVQEIFGIPSAITFPISTLMKYESKQLNFLSCPKCHSKFIDKCPICVSYEMRRREINVIQKQSKQPIPMIIFLNVNQTHFGYALYFIQLLRNYYPEKRFVLAFCRGDNVILRSSTKEIIMFNDEWLVNANTYATEAQQYTDEFLQSIFNEITPRTNIMPLLANISSAMMSHIVLLTSNGIETININEGIRKTMFHSSSAIDQFVFSVTENVYKSEVFSRDTNGHFFLYNQHSIIEYPTDCLKVIQSQRIYNLRIVTILPGFEVEAMTPKAFTYSSDQDIVLFVKCVQTQEEKYIQMQTQWYYQMEDGSCHQAIINETFISSNRLSELYHSYEINEYLINFGKYLLTKRHEDLGAFLSRFMNKLIDCMYNFYDLTSNPQLPFNRDIFGSFCCKLLNKPMFCCHQVDATNKDFITAKGMAERLRMIQLPWKVLNEYIDRDLFYVKLGNIEYKIVQTYNIPYQTDRFVGYSWLIQRVGNVAYHLIYKSSQEAQIIFGENWNELPEEELSRVWKNILDSNVSSDPMFFDNKLRRLKSKFKIIEDYGELIPYCYDGMANLYRDEALFKINFMKKIDEKKKRSEVQYTFSHF